MGIFIPLLLIGTGAGGTYWLTKDKPFPPELLEKIGNKALLDKYIDLRSDPSKKDSMIILDVENKCLIDTADHKTYMVVENDYGRNGETVLAEVVTKNNIPVYKESTLLNQQVLGVAVPMFLDDGDYLAKDAPIRVQYNKPGTGETVVKWINTTNTDFLAMHSDAVKKYLYNVEEEYIKTANNIVPIAAEFDKLPQEEKAKLKTRITPDLEAELNRFFITHEINPATKDQMEARDKLIQLEELSNMPIEKKLYVLEKAMAEKKISQVQMSLSLDEDFVTAMKKANIKIDSETAFADVAKAHDKSNELAPQIESGKSTSSSTNFADVFKFVKENPWTTIAIGLATMLGGGIGGTVAGWFGAPAGVIKAIGGIGGVLIVGAGVAALVNENSDTVKSFASSVTEQFADKKTAPSTQIKDPQTSSVTMPAGNEVKTAALTNKPDFDKSILDQAVAAVRQTSAPEVEVEISARNLPTQSAEKDKAVTANVPNI